MIFRGGKKLEGPKGVSNHVNLCDDVLVEKEISSSSHDVNDVVKDANVVPKDPQQISSKLYTLYLPFPQRMDKAKLDLQFEKFLGVLKKLYINVPFINAIS